MENSIRPYVLADTNWKTVKETDYTVAILPWGATEAHNYHLPYATDNFQAEFVAIEAAKEAWKKKAKVIVLPTIPFGVNTGQMDVKLCMNMSPSTQYAVLKDVAQVLNAHDIQKLVVVNSHGGNNFKQMIRELSLAFPKIFVCAINWWEVANASDYFNEPGDHAGELETSAIMHIKPHLVFSLEEAGNGKDKKFKIKGLKEGLFLQFDQPLDVNSAQNPAHYSVLITFLCLLNIKLTIFFEVFSTSNTINVWRDP